jgi:hypothetical protein
MRYWIVSLDDVMNVDLMVEMIDSSFESWKIESQLLRVFLLALNQQVSELWDPTL